MKERELALADLRAVAGEAGDASGSADRALYLLENGRDTRAVLEALQWAEEQARRAAHAAVRARQRVAALTPNASLSEGRAGRQEESEGGCSASARSDSST